jgi:hypothetical protein
VSARSGARNMNRESRPFLESKAPLEGFAWDDVLVPDPEPPTDVTGARVDVMTAEVADKDTVAVPSSTVK